MDRTVSHKQRRRSRIADSIASSLSIASFASFSSRSSCSRASAPLIIAAIGTAMSASSPYVKQALGEKAGDVCMWGGVALSLGGGGMQLAGVGAKAAENAGTEAKIAAWVARGAHVTEGTARVGEGVFTVKEKGAEADAQEEQATVLARRADAKRAQSDVDDTIRRLADLEASARRAIGTLLSAQGDESNARAAIVARMGRSVVA